MVNRRQLNWILSKYFDKQQNNMKITTTNQLEYYKSSAHYKKHMINDYMLLKNTIAHNK